MELNKDEARLIWNIVNYFQNDLYNKLNTQVKALEMLYSDNPEKVNDWMTESVNENDMLMSIKTKMMKVITEK